MTSVLDDTDSVFLKSVASTDPAAVTEQLRAGRWPSGVDTIAVLTDAVSGAVVLYGQSSRDVPAAPAGWVHYRRYRSTPVLGEGQARYFALNTFDAPDHASAQKWIDAVQQVERGARVPAGIIKGHTSIKDDGTGLLNCSGWLDAGAHSEFLASGVLNEAFSQLPPPGPTGQVNGGFLLHSSLTAPARQPSVFTDAELDYLDGQRLGRLATVQPGGTLQVTPVDFRHNPATDTIDIGGYGMERSRKYRNIADNGRAAFVIDDIASYEPWRVRCLDLRGRAEVIERATDSVISSAIGLDGPIIRFHPSRIVSFGIGEIDREAHELTVTALLDELAWWSLALRRGRADLAYPA